MFSNFKTGNVIVEYQESFKLNEQLTGKLSLSIEQGDSIEADTPILISLTKQDKVIDVKTMSLKEFIALSDNPTPPTTRDGKEYYETPKTYNVDISKIIEYTFVESGEYELTFNILKIDVTIRKIITVN